ncbi:MAG: hypothetical protein M1814_001611 [Vezdaea aestivalis]|nr:MAG: hypothetical protein M1814_001611 [Vezdaea aestivalis]
MAADSSSAHKGILHLYNGKLVAFEHATTLPTTPASSSSPPEKKNEKNYVLFLAGLGDGLLTVPYTLTLASSLPPTWTFVSVLLSSSFNGWGTSSLQSDAAETDQCVRYFRSLPGTSKIVLMGHSTGCQDCMTYLTISAPDSPVARAEVDGVIFQAPVSDREAIVPLLGEERYASSAAVARKWVDEGRGEDVLPGEVTGGFFTGAVSAQRWLSLLSPEKNGADDLFSSDLTDEQFKGTWGAIPASAPVLILYSGSDEFVPDTVDKAALVTRWGWDFVTNGKGVLDMQNSGLVHGASHNLVGDPESVVQNVVGRVVRYLGRLERGELLKQ